MIKMFFGIALATVVNLAFAWQPTGPIKVIVGQAPGGGNELAMRGVGAIIEKTQPVNFLIENHPGLDNVVAMNHFAGQKPDGQTLLVTAIETSFVAAPVAYRSNIKVDPNEYVPVTMLAQAPMAFVVPINSPIKNIPDLLAHLKNKPQKFNVGLSGSTNLLAYQYFVTKLKLDPVAVQPIRYNSPSAAVLGVANSDLDMAIVSISSTKALAGTKVRLLAHTGELPIADLPDVPLMKNYVPGLIIHASWAVFLPPKTPPAVAEWYAVQFKQALNTTQARAYFYTNWATINPKAMGPAGLSNNITTLRQQWNKSAEAVLRDQN
jgi:tripartite-type tricarboxylate transporter receptor subunit TctC